MIILKADLAEYLQTLPQTTIIAVNIIKNPHYLKDYQLKLTQEEAQEVAKMLGAKKGEEANLKELALRISPHENDNLIKVALGLRSFSQGERKEIINEIKELFSPEMSYWGLIYYFKIIPKGERRLIIDGIKKFKERDEKISVLGIFCILSQIPKDERQEIIDLTFDFTNNHLQASLISIMFTLKQVHQKDRKALINKMNTIFSFPIIQEIPDEPELTKIRDEIIEALKKYYTFEQSIPENAITSFFVRLAEELKIKIT